MSFGDDYGPIEVRQSVFLDYIIYMYNTCIYMYYTCIYMYYICIIYLERYCVIYRQSTMFSVYGMCLLEILINRNCLVTLYCTIVYCTVWYCTVLSYNSTVL